MTQSAMLIFGSFPASTESYPNALWLPRVASAIFDYVLPFALVSWRQLRVPSSLAVIFMAVMPLATILFAHVFANDETLNRCAQTSNRIDAMLGPYI